MSTAITWQQVMDRCDVVAATWAGKVESVFGVPQGGAPVAVAVAHRLNVPVVDSPARSSLVVDDLIDTGATLARFDNHHTDALFAKPYSPQGFTPSAETVHEWITFPWERDQGAPTDAVTRLLQYIGENPTRDGLLDTPARVVKALGEMTRGYGENPEAILSKTFDVTHNQMVHVRGITVMSMCEHHMLPFVGTAHVAYIPGERVVGLSKIPRVVHAFARRLQVQERLTEQVADAIQDHLGPKGVGVQVTAHHMCMGLRGVGEPNATMTTTALRGAFWRQKVRAEFLQG